MGDNTETVEADTAIGKFKISSANLNTVFTVLGFLVTALIAWVLWTHTGETKDASKELAGAMRDVAQAAREQNCLISLPQDKRETSSEICKRISR